MDYDDPRNTEANSHADSRTHTDAFPQAGAGLAGESSMDRNSIARALSRVFALGHKLAASSIAIALLLVLAIGAIVMAITWVPTLFTDASFSDSARTVQALGTITAIFAGGIFAYYKLQIFRDFAPHMAISHEVKHRLVGESYVHIAAIVATLHNNSRVKLELRKGALPGAESSAGIR